MHDDRDAWLDDVRRWYYGGTSPAGDHAREAPAPETPAPQRATPDPDPRIQRKDFR